MTLVLANLLRATVLVVLSFALVATGLAHRLPTAVQDDSLAFALQNGISLSDFCGGDLDEPMHPGTDCQACQTIGAGGLLPVSGIQIDLELACHSDVFAKLEFRAILRSPDLAHRPQGPPVA